MHPSHILRVIKRMFEHRVGRNLQNVPCSVKENVCLSAETETSGGYFLGHASFQDSRPTFQTGIQTDVPFRHRTSFAKQQSRLSSLGNGCFLCFDGCAVKHGRQCLPSQHFRAWSSADKHQSQPRCFLWLKKQNKQVLLFITSDNCCWWHSANMGFICVMNGTDGLFLQISFSSKAQFYYYFFNIYLGI